MYMSGKARDPNDPTNDIFDTIYICFVHAMSVKSFGYVEEYGLRSSGVSFVDEEVFGGNEMVGLTINDMIEKQRDGYGFEIRDPTQGVNIYHVINDYLGLFTRRDSLNHHRTPDKDLDDLDALANFLYEERNEDIRGEVTDGGLVDVINQRHKSGHHPLYKAYLQGKDKYVEPASKTRVSFRDFLNGDD